MGAVQNICTPFLILHDEHPSQTSLVSYWHCIINGTFMLFLCCLFFIIHVYWLLSRSCDPSLNLFKGINFNFEACYCYCFACYLKAFCHFNFLSSSTDEKIFFCNFFTRPYMNKNNSKIRGIGKVQTNLAYILLIHNFALCNRWARQWKRCMNERMLVKLSCPLWRSLNLNLNQFQK